MRWVTRTCRSSAGSSNARAVSRHSAGDDGTAGPFSAERGSVTRSNVNFQSGCGSRGRAPVHRVQVFVQSPRPSPQGEGEESFRVPAVQKSN
jgi:hypothetical protein